MIQSRLKLGLDLANDSPSSPGNHRAGQELGPAAIGRPKRRAVAAFLYIHVTPSIRALQCGHKKEIYSELRHDSISVAIHLSVSTKDQVYRDRSRRGNFLLN